MALRVFSHCLGEKQRGRKRVYGVVTATQEDIYEKKLRSRKYPKLAEITVGLWAVQLSAIQRIPVS